MNPKYAHSASVLEFQKIIELLAQEASSPLGREKAFLVEPLKSAEFCRDSFKLTDEIKEYNAYNGAIPLENLRDLRDPLDRARRESLLREDELYHFLLLSQLVVRLQSIREKLPRAKYPRLRALLSSLVRPSSLLEEFPHYLEEPGQIKENATPRLAEIIAKKKRIYARIHEILSRMISSPLVSSALQERIITTRDGRYVLLIRSEMRKAIKGIVHDRSSTGATLYIEPLSVLPLNNELKELEIEEKEEKERILRHLTGLIKQESESLSVDLSILAELDFAQAKAHLAERFSAIAPEIVLPGESLVLRNAYHPLLLEEKRKKPSFVPVPLNLELPPGVKGVIITGPNMGGKTVVLKSVGLLTLMALSGLEIPASPGTRIPFYPQIIADIGEEQSIEFSLSSFASHIRFYQLAVENADSETLVLFDEFGSSTDPDEGAALAQAIAEYVVDKGATLIITTHLGRLKSLPSQRKDFVNAGMEFDEEKLKPTYRLLMGQPGRSWAFQIAERLGLTRSVLEKAKRALPGDSARLDIISDELAKKLRAVEEYEQALKEKENRLERDREFLASLIRANEAKSKELEKARQEFAEKKEQILEEFLKKEKRRIVEEIKRQREKVEEPEKIASEAEKTISKKIKRLAELRELAKSQNVINVQKGDYVYIKSVRRYGEVIEGTDKNGYARVIVDGVKMRIHTSFIERAGKPQQDRVKTGRIIYERKELPIMLDFRGLTMAEVKRKLIPYIDQATAQNLESFVIIHGQGKGRLGDKVRAYLKEETRVETFRAGETNEGGDGVTIVKLKVKKG